MTPEEKARELIEKFYELNSNTKQELDTMIPMQTAKACALIVVDEILNIDFRVYYTVINYYQQVKEAINKL